MSKNNKRPRREHWIYDRKAQLRFWGNCGWWYNLEPDEVRKRLGVKSMYNWEGTEEEAYLALEESGGDW